MREQSVSRRQAGRALAAAAAACLLPRTIPAGGRSFRLRYIVASCVYGKLKLHEILPEVRKTGAEHIDIWPLRHGNQREQIEAMGHDRFATMLKEHGVKLGIITRFDKGPFGLRGEMPVARKLGARILISGSRGARKRNLKGRELKAEVGRFAGEMKPHIAAAEEHGLKIGIENHSGALIRTPDSLRWFADFTRSKHIGIALAPYHLPQDSKAIAGLIEDLGPRLVHFYAWQHGKGSTKKLPKEDELLQMPGRGPLDFKPLVAALKKIDYPSWTEIFMHPFPRGIPILGTAAEVTAEINRARRYLEECAEKM